MSIQYEHLRQTDDEGVRWLSLHRPDHGNVLDDDLREELVQALLDVQDDERVNVLVVTGSGRTFSTGGDIRRLLALKEDGAGFEKYAPLLDEGRRVVTMLHEMPKPVIAMVNGPAIGIGMNLALACDLRIASDRAHFAENFVQAGLHVEWGGAYHLPRLVGTGRALEILWTGRRIEAEEAEEIGLVQQVVPHEHLRDHTARLARRLAKAPPTALRLMKMAVLESAHHDLSRMLDFEYEAQAQCWNHPEAAGRIKAYAERGRRSRG